ncbi:MAG: insulinase family protein [Candidatus Pacebacteria bacterium]|nr:insulinase family protein [Candidatus Paceibacterota bacterium]
MKFSKKVLKNGLRVVTVPMKDNPTVTVLVLVGTGSDYEDKKVNGISHFLEHMCFKGTVKRPTAQSIAHELDSLGSIYNAFTDHEMTGYYAKADAKHFKQVFDVISDIYLNSTLPEQEIQKEKGVIVEEINMYEDMPHRHVHDVLDELMYGDQPAGRNVAGTKEIVKSLTRNDFIKYKKDHYVSSATTIIVAGKVTEKEVLSLVSKYFKDVPLSKKSSKVKTKELQKKPELFIKHKATDQTHFVIALRAFDLFDKRAMTLGVLGAVLGAGMSSRLFIKLREEMGVAYYVNAYSDLSLDHGMFKISAGVSNDRVLEVIEEILKECKKLTTDLVSEEELRKVKSLIIGNTKLSFEATDDIANYFGRQEILKKEMKTIEERAKEVEKVTSKDIQKLAREIFKKESLNLALIGPFTDKSKFLKILQF